MNLTLGILSMGAHETLENTLNSYKIFGLDKLAAQKIIFFNNLTEEDEDIADKWGYEHIGLIENIGIAGGYKELVDSATQPYFMFLENDWTLLERPLYHILIGRMLLREHQADVIRYRHRTLPGNPLWTRQFENREMDSPFHLLDCVHWRENPDKDYPQQIWKNWGFYFAEARNANWTNNPTMFRTDWLKDNIHSRMTGDIEKDLQPWWETTDFVVAQGEGLFVHNRLDR